MGGQLVHLTLHVGQRKLKCLLDSGTSHSFVAANIIHELRLKTCFADALEVALADNSVVYSREVVDLPVCFACNTTQDITCHIIPSLHSPIILAMDWLRKWNPHVDWLH